MRQLIRKITLITAASAVIFSMLALTMAETILAASHNLTPLAKVSFTFDDGYTSAYTQAAPTLAKYGFSGTGYIVTGCVGMTTAPNTCRADNDLTYMDWDQVKTLRTSYGWEIGSHSDTHPLLATTDEDQTEKLTSEQVIAELTVSKNALAAQGITATAFATPFGDWDQTVLAEIAKVYTSHRGYTEKYSYNSFPYNDYLLYTQPVRVGISVDTVKSYIDTAVANNQWLILTFHDIQPVPSSDPDDYQYGTADLDAIAAYVNEKNIAVVNITNGLVHSSADLLNSQTFDTAPASTTADTTVWNTDSPDTIQQDTANNGSSPSPTNSVSLESGTVDTHLFSPIVAIDPAQIYVVKCYLNVTANASAEAGAVSYYIDEYDDLGTWLSGKSWAREPSVFLENLNFVYTPSLLTVSQARLQLILSGNAGISAYVDNIKFLSPVDIGTGAGAKAGDANGDGKVDAYDLSILAANWNGIARTFAQGDFSGDGVVNAYDLSILASNWGK